MTLSIAILREENAEIAAAIRAIAYEPLFEPVLKIEHLPFDESSIEDNQTLVFTSANGVRAYAAQSSQRGHKVFTVGDNTADTAKAEGFAEIHSAGGNVEDLAVLLAAHKNDLRAPLYLRGEDVAQDLRSLMAAQNIVLAEKIIYQAIPVQKLSDEFYQSLEAGTLRGVAVFSSRGGAVFADLIKKDGKTATTDTIQALCISESVVESVSVLPFLRVLVASKPDRYGMVELLKQCFGKD